MQRPRCAPASTRAPRLVAASALPPEMGGSDRMQPASPLGSFIEPSLTRYISPAHAPPRPPKAACHATPRVSPRVASAVGSCSRPRQSVGSCSRPRQSVGSCSRPRQSVNQQPLMMPRRARDSRRRRHAPGVCRGLRPRRHAPGVCRGLRPRRHAPGVCRGPAAKGAASPSAAALARPATAATGTDGTAEAHSRRRR